MHRSLVWGVGIICRTGAWLSFSTPLSMVFLNIYILGPAEGDAHPEVAIIVWHSPQQDSRN